MAEQVTVNHFVVGSNPTSGAIIYTKIYFPFTLNNIEGTNSERHLGISEDLRKLGLALVELSLR